MNRRMLTPVAVLAGALAIVACAAAHAQPTISREELLARKQFVEAYAQSARCIIEGTRVAIMQGAQRREQVLDFLAMACLPGFRTMFIDNGPHLSAEAGAKLFVQMTDRAYDEAVNGPSFIIIH